VLVLVHGASKSEMPAQLQGIDLPSSMCR